MNFSTDNVAPSKGHDKATLVVPLPIRSAVHRKSQIPHHHAAAGLSRPPSNPFEDSYDSSVGEDSYQPSHNNTISSGSSFTQTNIDTPDPSSSLPGTHESDFFRDRGPPERKIRTPPGSGSSTRGIPTPLPAGDGREQSSESSSNGGGNSIHAVELPTNAAVARYPGQVSSPLVGEAVMTTTPELVVQEASEKQQHVTVHDERRGKRNIVAQKYMVTAGLIGLNTIFIFASWYWARYYYVYLPFIALPLVLNCIMIASIIVNKLRRTVSPEKIIMPAEDETIVMVIPCYNETLDECTRSLDSLVDQEGIEHHKRAIIIVCDGRVRGPDMAKTTADHLLEDVLTHQTRREKVTGAYRGWDGTMMDVEVAQGSYKGVPYFCIVKERNQGKRDSLIVVRSFLYKFNQRNSNPPPRHIFSQNLFGAMVGWLEAGMHRVDHLVGMDADTVFAEDCIAELLRESRYANTVGVCGYVVVDFSRGSSRWNPWALYQNAEYTIAQALRRLHQSVATKKVSCLPGCCQLLRICEYTCGDEVLIDLFGYHPTPRDGMLKQIRATASEDRNHVCLMLTTFPKAETRQALRARAFTDVPRSWSVYLSQRRRWTLGATSNDLLLVTARHCQWWERILAFSNVLCWSLNVFIVAAIGCMIVAFMSQPWWIIMAFAGVMIIPLTYYVLIALWLPRTFRDALQYLAGLALFVVSGPFLNIAVMLFACYNMDSFGWGKTRMVVADDETRAEMNEKSASTPMQAQGRDEEATVGMTARRPEAAHLAPRV